MPLKTNVGVSRKIADQNYGSRGASVNLEVELDSSLIQDPERFQDRIRQVFRLAQQAIDEELNRQQGPASHATNGAGNGHAAQASQNGNGNAASNGNGNGNGHAVNGNGNRQTANMASEKQLAYARQLAKGIQGLGIRRLEHLADKMYGKQLVALTTLDASGLIDTLKSIKAGEIDINSVLDGATS